MNPVNTQSHGEQYGTEHSSHYITPQWLSTIDPHKMQQRHNNAILSTQNLNTTTRTVQQQDRPEY